jgi:signal peptidase I
MNEITPTSPAPKPISVFKRFLKSFWGEILQIVIISIVIVIPFRLYVAQPFLVSGPSMDDTFANGEYLIVDELTYNFNDPKRGDVIIFHYPLDTKKFFIKRIIGLPGETVEIKNDTVIICSTDCQIKANKITLTEPYIKINKLEPPRPNTKVTLKADEYFVMGDNRSVSSDSRIWGPVKKDLISGRAFIRLLPLSRIDLFPGKITE